MGHGIAEGVDPTPAELGQPGPDTRAAGRMFGGEGVLVATGDQQIRVTTQFHRNDEDLCILEFCCQFPGSEEHADDWTKAAMAESEIRAILAGNRLFPEVLNYGAELEENDAQDE